MVGPPETPVPSIGSLPLTPPPLLRNNISGTSSIIPRLGSLQPRTLFTDGNDAQPPPVYISKDTRSSRIGFVCPESGRSSGEPIGRYGEDLSPRPSPIVGRMASRSSLARQAAAAPGGEQTWRTSENGSLTVRVNGVSPTEISASGVFIDVPSESTESYLPHQDIDRNSELFCYEEIPVPVSPPSFSGISRTPGFPGTQYSSGSMDTVGSLSPSSMTLPERPPFGGYYGSWISTPYEFQSREDSSHGIQSSSLSQVTSPLMNGTAENVTWPPLYEESRPPFTSEIGWEDWRWEASESDMSDAESYSDSPRNKKMKIE